MANQNLTETLQNAGIDSKRQSIIKRASSFDIIENEGAFLQFKRGDCNNLKHYKFRISVKPSYVMQTLQILFSMLCRPEYKAFSFKLMRQMPSSENKYLLSKEYLFRKKVKPVYYPFFKLFHLYALDLDRISYLNSVEIDKIIQKRYYNNSRKFLAGRLCGHIEEGVHSCSNKEINETIAEFGRFYLGGQFTIYFEKTVNINTEKKFLKNINYWLHRYGIQPGKVPTSDFKLSAFLSTRVDRDVAGNYISARKAQHQKLELEKPFLPYFKTLRSELDSRIDSTINQQGHYPGNRF